MARIHSFGAENNTITSGLDAGFGSGTPTIDAAVFRSGKYSVKINSLSSGTRKYYGITYSSDATPVYFRGYLRVVTLPSADNTVFTIVTGAGALMAGIEISSTGTLQLLDEDGDIGSPSSALSLNTWYRIEVELDKTGAGGSHIVKARLDGSEFAAATNRNISSTTTSCRFGGNLNAEAQTQGDWNWDDMAINDNTGSFQNSYPGSGQVVYLKTNAAGDNTAWTNTWANVSDETPDDASTLIASNTLDQISDFNIQSPDDWVFQGKSGNTAGFGEFANVRYRGMSFRAASTTLDAVSFQITSTGSRGMNVILTAADGSDLPTGSELANWEIANGTLTTSFTKYTLSPSYTLTKGTLYAIYFAPWNTSTHVYADDYRDIQNRNSNQYGAGKPIVMSSGVWGVSDSGNLDMYFALHGSNSIIGATDTINVVGVNVRFNISATTSTDPTFVVRVKASASGTVEESSTISPTSTTWDLNNTSGSRTPAITLYDLPGASTTAWTKSDLDSAQIGVRETATDADSVQVSTLWMQVDYTPSVGGATTYPGYYGMGFF